MCVINFWVSIPVLYKLDYDFLRDCIYCIGGLYKKNINFRDVILSRIEYLSFPPAYYKAFLLYPLRLYPACSYVKWKIGLYSLFAICGRCLLFYSSHSKPEGTNMFMPVFRKYLICSTIKCLNRMVWRGINWWNEVCKIFDKGGKSFFYAWLLFVIFVKTRCLMKITPFTPLKNMHIW